MWVHACTGRIVGMLNQLYHAGFAFPAHPQILLFHVLNQAFKIFFFKVVKKRRSLAGVFWCEMHNSLCRNRILCSTDSRSVL
jgi:hypothetical protein